MRGNVAAIVLIVLGSYFLLSNLGLINISSPIARALIGKEEGDVAEVQAPGGVRRYEIIAVSYL